MSVRKLLDGNAAAAEAMRLARVQVVSAYPITPQSPLAERLADFVADGSLKAKYIRVESEHTAMSAAVGAQLTGVRTGTATSSVGLALMHEVLGLASGCRVPIVMPVVNRSLVSPWSLWCDHQDTMAERDSGWIQLYVENCQEVLDTVLMAYRLAEDPRVLTPTMVCMDGFFLSHTSEAVIVPDQAEVDAFLPPYKKQNMYLDVEDPMFVNDLTPPGDFTEMRWQQKVGFDNALTVLEEVQEEFARRFGRRYHILDAYRCEDAEVVLVAMGSMSGTAKYVVNQLREQGKRVGVLRIVCFRPFPVEQLREVLRNVPVVGVMDRTAGLGAEVGPVCTEVRAALSCSDTPHRVVGFMGGLAGRDLSPAIMRKVFNQLLDIAAGAPAPTAMQWVDVRPDAMEIREVKQRV